jgi:hypothetical protein
VTRRDDLVERSHASEVASAMDYCSIRCGRVDEVDCVLLGDPPVDWDRVLQPRTMSGTGSQNVTTRSRCSRAQPRGRCRALRRFAGRCSDAKQLTYRDAVLYLGPPSAMTFSRLPASLCSDARYAAMRLERVRLTGAMDEESRLREQLKRECAPCFRDLGFDVSRSAAAQDGRPEGLPSGISRIVTVQRLPGRRRANGLRLFKAPAYRTPTRLPACTQSHESAKRTAPGKGLRRNSPWHSSGRVVMYEEPPPGQLTE